MNEAVENECAVATEELRHFYLLRHEVLSDPLKEIILRHFASRGQCPPQCRDSLNVPSQLDFFCKQLISRLAVRGAFVRIVQMRHWSPFCALLLQCTRQLFVSHCTASP